MSLIKNQRGYTFVELIIILAVLAAFCFIGYRVYTNQAPESTNTNTPSSANGTATASDVRSAPQIKSTEDLDKAQVLLDQTDPESSNDSDSKRLDREVSSF